MDCPSSADFQSLTKDDNTIIMSPYGSICVTRSLFFYPLPKYTERMKRLISNMHVRKYIFAITFAEIIATFTISYEIFLLGVSAFYNKPL